MRRRKQRSPMQPRRLSTDSQFAPAAAIPAVFRSALRGGQAFEPSLVRGAERTARTRMGGESAGERGFSVMAAQDAGSPILVRDPAGITEASGRRAGWVDPAHAAGNDAIGLTGDETFARLDAESASRSIHWVQAGAHRAEAGYLDPVLGWVGVRAESSGGGVHAALLPGSAEAAQVLGTHMSGLNAFLSEQHGPHATATMAGAGGRALLERERNRETARAGEAGETTARGGTWRRPAEGAIRLRTSGQARRGSWTEAWVPTDQRSGEREPTSL